MPADTTERQNHPLSMTGVFEVASNVSDKATLTGFHHRISMVGITCNGANRSLPKEYMIKALGYGAPDDILQPNNLYLLKGRFIPINDVKNPATTKHEFFYEASNRLLVGSTATFVSDLHDTVGVTGFGIVIKKYTIMEDSVQPKAVREGKAEAKPTTVFVLRHRDYHPIGRGTGQFTFKFLLRPYPHLNGLAQFIHLGGEVNVNAIIIDYDVEEAQYVTDVKGATVASGHEDLKKTVPAAGGDVTAAGRVKPPKFGATSKNPILLSSGSSSANLDHPTSSSSVEIASGGQGSDEKDDVPSLLFPPSDFAPSSFGASPATVPAKRRSASNKVAKPANTASKRKAKNG